jgi:hypothetical protein
MLNETSRFHLVVDVIDRVPKLRTKAAHLKEEIKNAVIDNTSYAHEEDTDRPEVANWIGRIKKDERVPTVQAGSIAALRSKPPPPHSPRQNCVAMPKGLNLVISTK